MSQGTRSYGKLPPQPPALPQYKPSNIYRQDGLFSRPPPPPYVPPPPETRFVPAAKPTSNQPSVVVVEAPRAQAQNPAPPSPEFHSINNSEGEGDEVGEINEGDVPFLMDPVSKKRHDFTLLLLLAPL